MAWLQREGRRLHYTVEGDGPGVVLVPGLGSGARLFGTLPRRFARAGFTCAAFDPVGLPPSGPLPAPVYDFDAAAADVCALAATLPAPVALVGTSLGGKVALRAAAAATAAIGRLVLLCSAAAVSARARRVYRMFELLATEVDGRWFGEFAAPFLFGATFHGRRPAVVDDMVRGMRLQGETRAFLQQQARALQSFDATAAAASCALPTLCLAGAEDTLTPADEVRATAELLPHGSYRLMPSAGHSLLLESAAAVDAVLEFLSGSRSSDPAPPRPT